MLNMSGIQFVVPVSFRYVLISFRCHAGGENAFSDQCEAALRGSGVEDVATWL